MKNLIWFFLICIIANHSCYAQTERVALVIGVRDYQYVPPLKNTINDARGMAAVLRSREFKVIESYNPQTKRELQDAIRNYFNLLNGKPNAVGLVYYSGHGMQVDGVNYLMPTSANPQIKADIDDQAVKMEYILSAVEQAGNSLNIFILDACRNNPFRSFSRSSDPGLNQVNAPKGSYVVYATAPGSVASDGTGGNGLFTAKLIKYINEPNYNIEQVFKYVARDVQRESSGAQVPWINYSYFGDFYFNDQSNTTDNQQASTIKDNSTNSSNEASEYFNKAADLYHQKEYRKAFEYAEKTVQLLPNDTSILMQVGVFFAPMAGENERAIGYIKKYLALGGNTGDAYLQLYSIYFKKNLYDEALKVVQKLTVLNPQNVDYLNMEFNCYVQNNRLPEAKAIMEKRAQLSARDKEARYFLGLICDKLKDTINAKKWLKEALQIDPNYSDALAELKRIEGN